jgi:hypothetical protein
MMTQELFTTMVSAWFEVYVPIIQAGVIIAVAASIVLAALIFISLLLRSFLNPGGVRGIS